MNRAKPKNKHAGRGGNNVSLHPLTPDQALSGLLRVKPADLKRLEAEEAQAKKKPKRR
jgi:hypothetical protein